MPRLAVWAARLVLMLFLASVFALGADSAVRAVFRLSPLMTAVEMARGLAGSESAPAPDTAPAGSAGHGLLQVLSAGLGILVLCSLFLRRRFFCRRVCPVGTLVDLVALLRRAGARVSRGFANGAVAGILAPKRRLPLKCPFLNWLLMAAALAVPLELGAPALCGLALDPLALFSRWFRDGLFSEWAGALVFLVIAAVPMFWRFQVCPCGAFQDFCYFIVRVPFRALRRAPARSGSTADPSASPRPSEHSLPSGPDRSSRRGFLGRGAATLGLAGICAACWGAARRTAAWAAGGTGVVRPPGSAPPEMFASLCSRCGQCVKACPTRILEPVPLERQGTVPEGVRNFLLAGTPEVTYGGVGFCDENCVRCGTVCPTGAISLADTGVKKSLKIAGIAFDLEKCLIFYQRECSICRRECTYGAVKFVWSDEEYAELPTIDADLCVGCGRCVVFCPGTGDPSESAPPPGTPKALGIVPLRK